MRPGSRDPPGRGVMQTIQKCRAGERDVVAKIDIADDVDALANVGILALLTNSQPDPVAKSRGVGGLLELEFRECEVRRCEA